MFGNDARHAEPRPAPAADALQEFWAPAGRDLIRIAFGQIERFVAERDYVRVHTTDRSYLLRSTLSSIELRLSERPFVRIHRSIIIALADIAGLRHRGSGAWSIVHQNGMTSAIGRRHLSDVRLRLGIDWVDR